MMTMTTESLRAELKPTWKGLLTTIARRLTAYGDDKRLINDLAAMDDHILADIGLSRTDIMRAQCAEMGSDKVAMLGRARNRRMS